MSLLLAMRFRRILLLAADICTIITVIWAVHAQLWGREMRRKKQSPRFQR